MGGDRGDGAAGLLKCQARSGRWRPSVEHKGSTALNQG